MSTRKEELIENLALAADRMDPETLVGPCGCDYSIGYQCECCFVHEVLLSARKFLEEVAQG